MYTLAIRTDADNRRAQNNTLAACAARAEDANTVADLMCRALLLAAGFADKATLKDVFGGALDMLSNEAGSISRDLDNEHLAPDLAAVDLKELREAFQRAIS